MESKINNRVLILGIGKIGRMISVMLDSSGDYDIRVGDVDREALARLPELVDVRRTVVDATDLGSLVLAMHDFDIVISALCCQLNPLVAKAALETGTSYFDLTEDVETTKKVIDLSKNAVTGQIFMPQCGLAPGFISIAGHHITKTFDDLDTLRLRVGALPQFPSNGLNYNLTWSTHGLINEYCNPCETIYNGKKLDVVPLEGLEHFSISGTHYEAFNTSGGLGSLCETLHGRVQNLNYKTIRFPGHRDLMSFLLNDLKMSKNRELLQEILENALPVTCQDMVVTFCTVTGNRDGMLTQVTDARTIYQKEIGGRMWSAIQITTAAGICAVVDLHANGNLPNRGLVRQEQVSIQDFLGNRFGQYYAQ